jgi:hypothetical protein
MDSPQQKIFNTAGVCIPAEHYMLPVLPRIPDIDDMVEGEFYFILHAPRQSGKTTFIQTLADKINADGKYYALCCSLGTLRGVFDDEKAIDQITDLITKSVKMSRVQALKSLAYPVDSIPQSGSSVKIFYFLNYLSVNLDKDLVVFFDEADCLTDPALITFPTYGEAIIRTLTQRLEQKVPPELANRWMDGKKLDMTGLLKDFQQFWEENSEMIGPPFKYKQSTPHLVLFAFLQRVLNGGVDSIIREYALGSRRLDLGVKYKSIAYPVELKVKRKGRYGPKKAQQSSEQILSYMDKLGAKEGWLVIFDKDSEKPWDEKLTWQTQQYYGKTIHTVGV